MLKSIKLLKKQKSMFSNMETFLRFKNVKVRMIQLTKEPEIKEGEEKPEFFPEFKLSCSFKNKKFEILISDKELNPNGNYQVLLNLYLAKSNNYITLKPFTNAQLFTFINQSSNKLVEEKKEEEIKK